MWSRKPTPVAISLRPVPSRSRCRSMVVSAVWRWICAIRGMAYPDQEKRSPLWETLSENSTQFLDHSIHFFVCADCDSEPVAITLIHHVSHQDASPLQLFVHGLHGPVIPPAPD